MTLRIRLGAGLPDFVQRRYDANCVILLVSDNVVEVEPVYVSARIMIHCHIFHDQRPHTGYHSRPLDF